MALAMALSSIATLRPATAEPGDIFTVSAPAVTDQAPPAADIMVGDASVSTQTGALSYGFAIRNPVGRNGTQPRVSLAYSSQSPIYGGLAASWSLAGVPMISEDTSLGRLSSPVKRFTSSMSGGRPLIEVTELGQGIRYRAANDASWIRYERHTGEAYYWRAYAPDGTTYYFGHHSDGHTTGCTIISDGYAPLTRAVDKFGNTIDYIYRPGRDQSGFIVEGECRLEAITWGQNSAAGVLGAFAAIEFDYSVASAPCSFVGSQTSYRSGVKIVTGWSRLVKIRVAAFAPSSSDPVTPDPIPVNPDHTRTITLTYSSPTADCPAPARHASMRELLSIQESAVGIDSPPVALPPITFSYGNASLEWSSSPTSAQAPWSSGATGFLDRDAYNLGWGYRLRTGGGWPTVEAMMVDVDGDGLLDRLTNAPYYADGGVKFCRAQWERNLGRDVSGAIVFGTNPSDPDPNKRPKYIELPTLKWASSPGSDYVGGLRARVNPAAGGNEQCSLNYQRTGYLNAATNATCAPGGTACPGTNYCANSQTDCVAKSTPVANTFFAWRWFDINGDGRTDLIGSPIQGGVHSYNLYWGTGVSGNFLEAPPEPSIFGTWPACPAATYKADPSATQGRPYTMCNGMFPWMVYLNRGNGDFGLSRSTATPFGLPRSTATPPTHATWGAVPDRIIYQPIPLETTTGDSSVTAAPVGETQGTIDIDGDGYLDAVYRPMADGPTAWSVFFNDRAGRFASYSGAAAYMFSTGPNYKLARTQDAPTPKSVEGLFDFLGDGIIDHWIASCPTCTAQGAISDGTKFRLPGGVPELSSMKPGVNSRSYGLSISGSWIESGWRVDSRSVLDVDGDGRPDIAEFPDESDPFGNGIPDLGPPKSGRPHRYAADNKGKVTPLGPNDSPATPRTTPQAQGKKHPTERAKERDGLDQALEQESGITAAQGRVRGQKTYDDGTPAKGTGDAAINSTRKTTDNTDNRTRRVRSKSDVDDME